MCISSNVSYEKTLKMHTSINHSFLLNLLLHSQFLVPISAIYHLRRILLHNFETCNLLVDSIKVFSEILQLELILLPFFGKANDLIDDLDACEAAVLRLADAHGIEAFLCTEDIDIQHPCGRG